MQEDIIKERHLIKEFMGYKCRSFVYKYYSSWSYLMDLVEEIESINDDKYGRFSVHIYSNVCCIQSTRTDPFHKLPLYMSDPNAILNSKIESTYYNVVSFIKWYTQHKQTSNK